MECLVASKACTPRLAMPQTAPTHATSFCANILHPSLSLTQTQTPRSRGWMQARGSDHKRKLCAECLIASLKAVPQQSYDRRSVIVSSILAGLGSYAAQAFPGFAAVSKKVKLKGVENLKLQDALRAAVAGDLITAEVLFSELIEEDGESASAWSNRGSVRLSLGNFEEAAQDLTEAVRLAPNAPVPFLNRAIAYEALGRFQEAVSDCKSAIVNDPEEYAAWYNLGNVDVRLKDYPSALAAYERASNLAPGIAGYRLKQALVLFQLQKPEEASKLIQGLVRKYPNYAEAHAALAAVLWSEDRRSSAEEQFSKALYEEPKFQNIR